MTQEQAAQILLKLSMESITYITLGEAKHLPELYDAVLEIDRAGNWTFKMNE